MSEIGAQKPTRESAPVMSPGFVYFIQEGHAGLVKIGWAVTPTDRFRNLRAGNPRELRLIRTIAAPDQSYERELHRFYREYQVVREWFDPAVLSIEPPLPPGKTEFKPKPNLPPRLCGHCGVAWEDHDEGCELGWQSPEAAEWEAQRRANYLLPRAVPDESTRSGA